MSNQQIRISTHTNDKGIAQVDIPTGISNQDQDIQLIISFETVKQPTKITSVRVPGIDEGRFVVPDDLDDPLPPDLLKAFES